VKRNYSEQLNRYQPKGIPNKHSSTNSPQHSIMILPQTNRGFFILTKDPSSGLCVLPKVVLPANSNSVDLYKQIEETLLDRFGYGYEMIKTEYEAKRGQPFDPKEVITPLVDFDVNTNSTYYVYYAQALEQVISGSNLDARQQEQKINAVVQYMSIVDIEKELADPELIRDVSTRYTLSFILTQKVGIKYLISFPNLELRQDNQKISRWVLLNLFMDHLVFY